MICPAVTDYRSVKDDLCDSGPLYRPCIIARGAFRKEKPQVQWLFPLLFFG